MDYLIAELKDINSFAEIEHILLSVCSLNQTFRMSNGTFGT